MQQLMTQRTSDEQTGELRKDFDRLEHIQHFLSAKAQNTIELEDKEQYLCNSLDTGISTQVIEQYISKLN